MKVLHTSDWQLGMTRHFLTEEAQSRFTEARLEAITTLGQVAQDHACECIIVAGDVFESNQVQRQIVVRALERMGEIPLPIYLLPGNHDPVDAGSVFYSRTFTSNKPNNVVVMDTSDIHRPRAFSPHQAGRPAALIDVFQQILRSVFGVLIPALPDRSVDQYFTLSVIDLPEELLLQAVVGTPR